VTNGRPEVELVPAPPWTTVGGSGGLLGGAAVAPFLALVAGFDPFAFADAVTGGANLVVEPPRPLVPVSVVLTMPTGLNFVVSQSSVLQRLLAQQAQVRLTPANNTQFSALLPNSLRSQFSGEHLLLRSLVNNGRVIMIVVADQGGGPFSEISVQAFGKTAQCIEKALHSFSHRGQ